MGHLNAVLNSARRDVQVLLCYPIYDLRVKYLPVAGPLKEAPQLPRALRMVRSFIIVAHDTQGDRVHSCPCIHSVR
jgi:hypothetical protein